MKAYSYHTFVLPFTWTSQMEGRDNYSEFIRNFDTNKFWMDSDKNNESRISKEDAVDSSAASREYYKEYQYFNSYVREAVYGFGKGIVRNYIFAPERVHNKAQYHIYKGDKHYLLYVNNIRLKVFNTGIALFILECENRGTDGNGNSQANLSAVKDINDYGRRIALPYIPEKGGYSISADKLEIIIGEENYSSDWKGFVSKLYDDAHTLSQTITMNHTCKYIKELLSKGSEYRFSCKSSIDRTVMQVVPLIDDRMYVLCSVTDKDKVEAFARKENDAYAFENDTETEKSLYELAYLDNAGGCTCSDSKMRKELIEAAVYRRWLEEKTLYSVTAQGVVMLTSAEDDGKDSFLIESFLTQYVQMAVLCVAQRASVLKFKREAAEISSEVSGKKNISQKVISKIMNLQERYVAFEGHLNFEEVTSQEQGIEMYGMLREKLNISKEAESIRNTIDHLYEVANTSLGVSVNKIAVLFTFISFIMSIASLIYSYIFTDTVFTTPSTEGEVAFLSVGAPSQWVFFAAVFALCVALGIFVIAYYRKRK